MREHAQEYIYLQTAAQPKSLSIEKVAQRLIPKLQQMHALRTIPEDCASIERDFSAVCRILENEVFCLARRVSDSLFRNRIT